MLVEIERLVWGGNRRRHEGRRRAGRMGQKKWRASHRSTSGEQVDGEPSGTGRGSLCSAGQRHTSSVVRARRTGALAHLSSLTLQAAHALLAPLCSHCDKAETHVSFRSSPPGRTTSARPRFEPPAGCPHRGHYRIAPYEDRKLTFEVFGRNEVGRRRVQQGWLRGDHIDEEGKPISAAIDWPARQVLRKLSCSLLGGSTHVVGLQHIGGCSETLRLDRSLSKSWT